MSKLEKLQRMYSLEIHQNLLEHMLEIRGVGIVDMMTLFGASAVKSDKRILIVIDLEIWDPG